MTTRPPNAPTIWLSDSHIYLQFPNANGLTHQVVITNNLNGFAQLQLVLKARNEKSTIGTKGDPTQHQLERELSKASDAYLRSGGKVQTKPKPKFSDELRDSTRKIMRGMGLI